MTESEKIVIPINVEITMPMRRKTKRNMVRPYGLDERKNTTGDEGLSPRSPEHFDQFSNQAKSGLRQFYSKPCDLPYGSSHGSPNGSRYSAPYVKTHCTPTPSKRT